MTASMRRRLAACFPRLLALAALAALAGCGTMIEARFDPALFPRQATAEPAFDGRVAVLTDLASLQMTVLGERLRDLPMAQVQVPIGRIVHEASLAAFGAAFRGGAQWVDRIGSEPAAQPLPTVALRVAQYVYRDRLQYFIPLGPLSIERSQLDLQLVVELRLLDASGTILWSGSYDSGIEIYAPPTFSFSEPREKRADGLVRLTHETAYRLMQQAARDVGEWLRNERLRERPL